VTIEDAEVATAGWVHWFNHRRLYEYCDDVPPVELETPTTLNNEDQSPAEFVRHFAKRARRPWNVM
jgi:putative transposase